MGKPRKGNTLRFAAAARYLCEINGMAEKDIAEYCGKSLRMMNYILKGERGATPETMLAISHRVGVSIEDMISLGRLILEGKDPELFSKTETMHQAEAHITAPAANITAEATTEINAAEGMLITKKVLESGTGYANALWHNLKSFDAAVDREAEVGEMKEMMERMLADNKRMMEKIDRLEKAVVPPEELGKKRDSAVNA